MAAAFHRSDWTPIDLSHIPVKAPTRDSGGQNTVIFMKLSTRASSLFLYVFSLERNAGKVYRSVPKRFFGIRDFPYLKLGIFKQTRGEIRDLKFCAGVAGGMLNITNMITGWHEISARDYGIEEPCRGPPF